MNSEAERRAEAFHRAATALYSHWKEGSGAHTRLFETLVPDEFVVCGRSVSGGSYREHVVPCATIRDESMRMFGRGETIDAVAGFIEGHLKIVLIAKEEARRLNEDLQLKSKMPAGWKVGDDVMARLTVAGIEIAA